MKKINLNISTTLASPKNAESVDEVVDPVLNPSLADSLDSFDCFRITLEKRIPHPIPTIKIAGGAIASNGNITGVSADAKAGKTAVSGIFLAGAISRDGLIDGFEEIEVLPNVEGKAVVHFDTEQSEADQHDYIATVLKRANTEPTPDYFLSYNIRQLNYNSYIDFTNRACELSAEKFGGIHLIVIDGAADFLTSVNDDVEAKNTVQYFTSLAKKFNCPVILIIHLNPKSEKERGHLGSEIQRKCYGLITISKENDISTLKPKILRKAGNNDIPDICFTYSKDKGYHVQVDCQSHSDVKSILKVEEIKELANKIFPPPTALTHTDAVAKIMEHTLKGMTTSKTQLTTMKNWGIIIHGEDKRYRLKV